MLADKTEIEVGYSQPYEGRDGRQLYVPGNEYADGRLSMNKATPFGLPPEQCNRRPTWFDGETGRVDWCRHQERR